MQRCFRYVMVALLAAGLCLQPHAASADIPYRTFSYDSSNGEFRVQPAYMPLGYIGLNLVAQAGVPANLNSPNDLFIDGEDNLYIADTKNNRIVHLDKNNRFIRAIGTAEGPGQLKEPNGIYVNQQHIYVADTGNKRIAVYDKDGRFQKEYLRPETPLLQASFSFEPTKLTVDKRGFLYITTNNGYQGLIVLDSENGQFQGFFGANRVPFNLIDYIKRKVYTEDQLRKEIKKLPGSVSNVMIDDNGIIYTTSISVANGQIKKLNFAGKDLLGEKVYGDQYIRINDERLFVDIAVDAIGNMTAIDANSGYIYQYDSLGELLFAFGGKNAGYNKLGLFDYPSSIAINSKGNLYITDRTSNLIQIFRPTEFAGLVHEASELFMQGKYEESEGPWKKVLHLNSMYYKAHLGLAKSYYRKGEWQEALTEFKLARNTVGYSDAFWQIRVLWLQKNFGPIASWIVVLLVLYLAGRKLWRSKKWRKRDGRTGHSPEASHSNHAASG